MSHPLIRALSAFASLFVVSLAFAFADQNAATSYEWNVETNTFVTSLPEVIPSTIAARSCMQCQPITLQVTKDTKLLLGDAPASLRDMRQAAKKKHFMMIFYAPT